MNDTTIPIVLTIDPSKAEEGGQRATRTLDQIKQSTKETLSGFEKFQTGLSGIFDKVFSLRGAIAAFIGTITFKDIIKEAADAERAISLLNQALKTTGGSSGFSSSQLQEMAKGLEALGVASQTSIIKMQTALLAFDRVQGDVFKRTQNAILDITARKGGDLEQWAIQIGRALQNPAQGFENLRRAGITFGDKQKDLIAQLAATGHGIEAQGIILKRIEQIYGGSAAAAADTLAGSQAHLKIAFAQVEEALGTFLNKGGRLKDFFNDAANAMSEFARNVPKHAANIKTAFDVINGYAKEFAGQFPIASKYIGEAATGIGKLGKAFLELTAVDWVEVIITDILKAKGEFQKFAVVLSSPIPLLEALNAAFFSVFTHIADLFNALGKDIANFFAHPLDGVSFENVKAEIDKGFGGAMSEAFKKAYDDAQKVIDEKQKKIDADIAAQIAAEIGSIEALSKANQAAAIEQHKQDEAVKNAEKNFADLTNEMQAQIKAQEQYLKQITATAAGQERLLGATKLGIQAARDVQDSIERETKLIELKLTLNDKLGRQIDAQMKQAQQFRHAIEDVQKARAEVEKPFSEAADSMFSAFTDAFGKIASGGKNVFQDLGNAVKQIFVKLAAEIAALMIFKPQLITQAGGLLSAGSEALAMSFGFSNGQFPGQNQASGGMSPLSAISDLSSLGKLFGFSGATNAIDSFGAANLGLANVSTSFVGPLLPGQVAGTTLSGILGAAGIGGLIGSLNLFGGNQLGSSLGGTAGGAIGSIIAPGIGTIIGSALGSAIGGLFGGGKPHPQAGFSGVINDTGGLDETHLGAKHLTIADAQKYQDLVAPIVQSLVTSGVNLAGQVISAGVFNGKGFFAPDVKGNDSPNKITFDASDTKSATDALNKFIVNLVTNSKDLNENITKALPNIQTEGRKTEEVLADVAFALNFDKLGEPVEKISDVKAAMDSLKDVFDKAAETAKRLGLEEAKVEEARQKALQTLREGFNQTVARDILAANDNVALGVLDELTRYHDQLNDALLIGADLSQVELLHQTKLSQLAAQMSASQQEQLSTLKESEGKVKSLVSGFQALSVSIDKSLQDIRLGSNSTLNPEQKVAEARALFETTLAQAKDQSNPEAALAAGGKLGDLGKTLLELSRNAYASSEKFVSDFNLVNKGLGDIKDAADDQARFQQRELDKLDKQIALMEETNKLLGKKDDPLAKLGGIGSSLAAALADPSINQGKNAGGLSNADLLFGGRLTRGEFSTIRSVVTGYQGDFGAGGFASFIDAKGNEDKKAAFIQVMRALGIPGYADGGLASAFTTFMVGERGPEIMRLRQPAQITPLHGANDNASNDNGRVIVAAIDRQTLTLNKRLATLETEMRQVRQKLGKKA